MTQVHKTLLVAPQFSTIKKLREKVFVPSGVEVQWYIERTFIASKDKTKKLCIHVYGHEYDVEQFCQVNEEAYINTHEAVIFLNNFELDRLNDLILCNNITVFLKARLANAEYNSIAFLAEEEEDLDLFMAEYVLRK